jgi:hypothetical protein
MKEELKDRLDDLYYLGTIIISTLLILIYIYHNEIEEGLGRYVTFYYVGLGVFLFVCFNFIYVCLKLRSIRTINKFIVRRPGKRKGTKVEKGAGGKL